MADYDFDEVEIWPENWPEFNLFCQVRTQWRVGMSGATGLDYCAVYPLLDRLRSDPIDWNSSLEDIRAMERTALAAMREQ